MAVMLYAKETTEQNSTFQETLLTYLFLYYKSNFRQTRHLYSSVPLRVARTRTLLSQLCYQIFSVVVFTSISSAFPTWMLKEMSRIESSSAWISGNTLRPALIAGCLFAWFEEHPLAFSYKDNPVLDEISAEKYQIQSVSDEMPERHGR